LRKAARVSANPAFLRCRLQNLQIKKKFHLFSLKRGLELMHSGAENFRIGDPGREESILRSQILLG
jgi:hypothetical protein